MLNPMWLLSIAIKNTFYYWVYEYKNQCILSERIFSRLKYLKFYYECCTSKISQQFNTKSENKKLKIYKLVALKYLMLSCLNLSLFTRLNLLNQTKEVYHC